MTATIADPDTHLDTIEHLDWTPVCQVENCAHGRPPATHQTLTICGCHTLVCQPCTNLIKLALKANLWTDIATCKRCGKQFRDIRIRQLYVTIQPL